MAPKSEAFYTIHLARILTSTAPLSRSWTLEEGQGDAAHHTFRRAAKSMRPRKPLQGEGVHMGVDAKVPQRRGSSRFATLLYVDTRSDDRSLAKVGTGFMMEATPAKEGGKGKSLPPSSAFRGFPAR